MPAPEPTPASTARFPFRLPTDRPLAPGDAAMAPLLSIQLESLAEGGQPLTTDGLLDTGASVSVLPYGTGIALGAVWPAERAAPLRLGGNLSGQEAHPLLLTVHVADFAPVHLAFAWTRAERIPLMLGQTNFFLEFDVCFYRSRLLFDVRPKHA